MFNLKELIYSGSSRSLLLKKNIIGSLLLKGISIVISLMFVPLTLGYVSSEMYGIWLTLTSILHWLTFFDVGFTQGLKNRLAEALALNDYQKGKALVSTTYTILMCIFIPLVLVAIFVIPYINWPIFLNVNSVYNDDINRAMIVLIICFGIQMISNVLIAVVSAYQQVALSSSFGVIGQFLSLIVVFIITKVFPPSLFILTCAVSSIPCVVIIFMSIVMYSNKFKNVAPSIKYINFAYLKDLFVLGYKFFLIQIQFIVLYQTTNFLISYVSGPNDVTIYNIAYKYLSVLMMTFNIFMAPLWPAFTDAYTKCDYSWMKHAYNKMNIILFVCIVVVSGMVFLSSFAYKLWIGDSVSVPFIMTTLIAVYVVANMCSSLQVNIINGVGKLKVQTIVTLIGIVFHVPLSLLLGKYIGCYGVIVSMIIITTLYAGVFGIQVNKILNEKATGIWNK